MLNSARYKPRPPHLPAGAVPLPADRWAVLRAVCTHRHPSLRSVADATGIPWGSIHGHLSKLRDLGLVGWTPGHVGSLHAKVTLEELGVPSGRAR